MAHGESDADYLKNTHNLSRFCMEYPQITWVMLVLFMVWGVGGWLMMPQRKDPDVPVRQSRILCEWPGNNAEKVELLITKKIEDVVQQNNQVATVRTVSRPGLCQVDLEIDEFRGGDPAKVWDDINIKLQTLKLPDGAGPVYFNTNFGDTLALMLSVASPPLTREEVAVTAKPIEQAIRKIRKGTKDRVTIVYVFPPETGLFLVRQAFDRFITYGEASHFIKNPKLFEGPNWMGIDFTSDMTDSELSGRVLEYIEKHILVSEIHPDAWWPAVIRDPSTTLEKLIPCAGPKYSYKDLDVYTEKIMDRLKSVPDATMVDRAGVVEERIYLVYSQERLASYGMPLQDLKQVLQARNISGAAGGQETAPGAQVNVQASGEFKTAKEIGDVPVTQANGAPVYLRDLVNIVRTYESPPTYLTYLTYQDASGQWVRARSNIVSVQMRPGLNINDFAVAVDAALDELMPTLPKDLVIRKTSNQPEQVKEGVGLFTKCLAEAVVLVVIVSLIGFWEWRSALLMALAIPITLAMTFAFMSLLRLDIQQVSIASLIIALGLLVDDPVVAGDAIKRALAAGHKAKDAAWLGPTKLATAILYATITNIVAYLPLMGIAGDTGRFLYSLPLVIACSLVASRLSSMTFIPLLGSYILRPSHEPPVHELREKGLYKLYYRFAGWCVDHRWLTLAASFLVLGVGVVTASQLESQFFPKDLQYICYADVFLPSDSGLRITDAKAYQVEKCFLESATQVGQNPPPAAAAHGVKPGQPLECLATFVGGGSPRFWSTLDPESPKLNYAMIVAVFKNKNMTSQCVGPVQRLANESVAGARVDVRELESGKPVGTPVSIRVYGDDSKELYQVADEIKQIYRSIPDAVRIRDNWYDAIMTRDVDVDPDKANAVGVTNADVAQSIQAAFNGVQMTYLREGHRQIPVVARMRSTERSQLEDLRNIYVYSTNGQNKIRLGQIADVGMKLLPQTIFRRNYHRCIEVGCYPRDGILPSQVFNQVAPKLAELKNRLPRGVSIEVGGEQEEQEQGFLNLAVVLLISVTMIYLALLSQFKNAIKPLVVFAAIPYGMVGALVALWVMGQPFGFMAFLGCTSLVGVIVSHVIVLFDYIEEMHAEGEGMRESLLDAGIARLRPVFITVGATVIALFPLAKSGGPLWEPLCYTQIGGLMLATLVTLVLVPVLYTIAVTDLKILRWGPSAEAGLAAPAVDAHGGAGNEAGPVAGEKGDQVGDL